MDNVVDTLRDELHPFLLDGNVSKVQQLLQQKFPEGDEQDTSLLSAVFIRSMPFIKTVEMANLFINQGASVTHSQPDGWTALHSAVSRKNVEVAEFLVEQGAVVDAVQQWHINKIRRSEWILFGLDNDLCETPLRIAVDLGNLDLVRLLLRNGANLDDPALSIIAIERYNIEMIQYLFGQGYHPHSANLHCAALSSNMKMVDLLLEKGCDLEAPLTDTDPSSPLISLLRSLLWKNDPSEIVEKVRCLLEYGANPNAVDDRGRTVLQVALDNEERLCSTEVSEMLLEHGAEVTGNVLHVALRSSTIFTPILPMVELLLERGADLEAPVSPNNPTTALVAAISFGHHKDCLVRLLLERGANAEAVDIYGQSCLHIAVQKGKLDQVRMLLDHRANIEARSRGEGDTPLHLAARHGNADIMELLLLQGAQVNVQNQNMCSPLHLALQPSNPDAVPASWDGGLEMVQALVDRGANLTGEDVDGLTPLYYAAKGGKTSVVHLLLVRGACF